MAERPDSPLLRFVHFLRVEAASSSVLLFSAAVALIWANSSASHAYQGLWQSPLGWGAGALQNVGSLQFWVNDALMALFFLLVGLEIRRERHEGTLADARLATLPVVAALGGVLVPALIYSLFNGDTLLWRGWAVPTATDIAFAIGVLALLGKRVPASLRVLLLAIAIIDDIVGILVIAIFYSHGIGFGGLTVAIVATAALAALPKSGVRSATLSLVLGAVIWAGLLSAGVHPALSGVIVGLLTPVTEARRLEHALHPWVAFAIMPLFALANAGINLSELDLHSEASLLLVGGIMTALVLGKPVGIVLVTALTVRLGWCELPSGVDLKRIAVIGCLAGIGFTMAIFVSQLAFAEPAQLVTAKLAILIGSSVAAVVGLLMGRRWLPVAVPKAAT